MTSDPHTLRADGREVPPVGTDQLRLMPLHEARGEALELARVQHVPITVAAFETWGNRPVITCYPNGLVFPCL